MDDALQGLAIGQENEEHGYELIGFMVLPEF